jgi:hypothetical protein
MRAPNVLSHSTAMESRMGAAVNKVGQQKTDGLVGEGVQTMVTGPWWGKNLPSLLVRLRLHAWFMVLSSSAPPPPAFNRKQLNHSREISSPSRAHPGRR